MTILPDTHVSPLRLKLIDDMNFRHVSAATAKDVRQFQLAQSAAGVPVPPSRGYIRRGKFRVIGPFIAPCMPGALLPAPAPGHPKTCQIQKYP